MRWLWCLLIVCIILNSTIEAKKKKNKKSRSSKRMMKCHRMMSPLQEEITQLQDSVKSLSNPIHVHLHGVADGAEIVSASPVTGMSSEERTMVKKHKHEHKESGDEDDSSEETMDEPHHSHVHIHLNVGAAQGEGHSHSHQKGTNKCHGLVGEYSLDDYIHAKCDMMPNNAINTEHNVRGTVYLRQKPNQPLEVKVNIYGFNTKHDDTMGRVGTLHGFHVHEYGDFQNGCNSFGGHFNPEGHDHGGPDGEHKHTGDWGNVQTDHRGVAIATFNQTAFLYGPHSLVGRGIVVHAGKDDHGMGGTHSSRTTGSAGARVACCVIAIYKGGVW